MSDQKPVYNTAGTHVFLKFTETGVEWECPASEVERHLVRGFELCEPRDASLDGLYDPEVLAAKQQATAKKAAPSSKTGD